MKRMQHLLVAVSASLGALGASMGAACAGKGTVTVIRPGPCSAQDGYAAAEISTATPAGAAPAEGRVSVIRYRRAPHSAKGWAAQRLLQGFDLQTGEGGVRIVNASPFCVEER